jgi:hypothetical protein
MFGFMANEGMNPSVLAKIETERKQSWEDGLECRLVAEKEKFYQEVVGYQT